MTTQLPTSDVTVPTRELGRTGMAISADSIRQTGAGSGPERPPR